MALEARRHITLITTHTNQGNALYWLLIPLESYSGYKLIQKYDTLDHDNCIARGLHNGEFWSSGKMVLGGYGWGGVLCRIFPTKKISINSYLTVCKHFGIRAHHYTNMGYICAVCPLRRHFRPPKKKLKKTQIPPCVSTRLVISYAALRPPQVKRSNFGNRINREQRQLARV